MVATSNSGAQTSRIRGHKFLVTTDTMLTSFTMPMIAPEGTDIVLGVWEATSSGGTFALVGSRTLTIPALHDDALVDLESGPLNTLMEAGKYYVLGAWWTGNDARWRQGAPTTADPPWGQRLGAGNRTGLTSLPTSTPIGGGSGRYGITIVVNDERDLDGDGVLACADCDDGDAARFAGNPEVCDGLDNDCSGFAEAGGEDADGDGYLACADCDDSSDQAFPGGTEVCDALDNDCDGSVDNDLQYTAEVSGAWPLPGSSTVYVDLEVYSDVAISDVNVQVNIDHEWTDDLDIYVLSPAGTQVMLSTDNGSLGDDYIDTLFDDEAATSIVDASAPFTGTFQPEGDLSNLDGEASGGTWQLRVTNDQAIRSGTVTGFAVFVSGDGGPDLDGDGFTACGDCNDSDAAVSPSAVEVCDGVDNDCDPTTDVAGDLTDVDGDGVVACLDCDDADPVRFPGAVELCNEVDDDCDPTTFAADENVDADGDGFSLCRDCNDGEPLAWTGADELCDGVDNDCDGIVDGPMTFEFHSGETIDLSASSTQEVASGGTITDIDVRIWVTHYWADELDVHLISPLGTSVELATDNSGSGSGYIGTIFDDEATVSITTGTAPFSGSYQPEGLLSDLDGDPLYGDWTLQVDDDSGFPDGQLTAWTLIATVDGSGDYDGDGWTSCLDCDDSDAARNPDEPEVCDGLDCEPDAALGADELDGDGDGMMPCEGDCDDEEVFTYPGAPELCDGEDNDCEEPLAVTFPQLSSDFASAGTYRGNAVQADRDSTLDEYEQRVVLDAGETTWIGVYRQDFSGGPLRLLRSAEHLATSTGGQWVSTGPINVPIEDDEVYVGLVWFADGARFYHSYPESQSASVGFGDIIDGVEGVATALPETILNPTGYADTARARWHWGGEADADGDGWLQCDGDCADDDPTQVPGFEVCDGVDNDCVGGDDGSLVSVETDTSISINTMSASGFVSMYVAADVAIGDVNLTVDIDVTSTDISLRLRHPSGIEIDLFDPRSWEVYTVDGATFDDEARVVADGPLMVARVVPHDGLSTFDGLSSRGEWRLYTVDESPSTSPGRSYVLDGWSLEITAADPDIGTDAACTARSCNDLLDGEPLAPSDIYWLETADGDAYETLCDMDHDGGGWTLVANIDDANDPYFGGYGEANPIPAAWFDAWEDSSTRNVGQIPTMNSTVSVSTKYASWADIGVFDVRVWYPDDDRYFLCEDLDDSLGDLALPGLFAGNPAASDCSSVCTTWSQDRFLNDPPVSPAGLNCRDNETFGSATSESARIGGYYNQWNMSGFAGTTGDRTPHNDITTHTWATDNYRNHEDSNVLIFVR